MRIISGKFKGRRFSPPADNWPTRPTTDYAKEGLFNVLNNWFYFEDQRFLDLFGGTGSHDYEFLSRGCTDVTYVDKHGPAVSFVQRTIKTLGVEEHIRIFRMDVFKFIAKPTKKTYTYIFAGPPYPLPNIPDIPDLVFKAGLLAPDGLFVMETNPHHDFSMDPRCTDKRNYGKTIFWFFEYPTDGEEE